MLAGLILAGGKSSRMGTDKSLLTQPTSQQTLLEHCKQQLALVCNKNIFISGAQHELGIADVIPNCGPLSGIHAGITCIETEHRNISELLIVAVDMPNLWPEDFYYLIKMGREQQSLCSFENCYLPLYLPLSAELTLYLDSILMPEPEGPDKQVKQQKFSIKQMLNSLQGLQVQPLQHTRLNNINTPLQWQQHCANQN